MLIKQIMVSRNLLTVAENDRLATAAQKMLWGRLRHLPVVRRDEVVGVLSERDILDRRSTGEPVAWEDELVGNVMTTSPAVTVPDEEVAHAAARMAARKIGCLPVVQHGRLVGMVTTSDLLGAAVTHLFGRPPRLRRPVREVMREEVFSVRQDQSVMEAVDLMASLHLRHVPVVDDHGHVVGVLSDRDIRGSLGDPSEVAESWPGGAGAIRVGLLMTSAPIVIGSEAPLSEAIDLLLRRRVGALPVVDQAGRLTGILSYVDVIRALQRMAEGQ